LGQVSFLDKSDRRTDYVNAVQTENELATLQHRVADAVVRAQSDLKRAIQKEIENPMGRLLVEGKIRDGQTLVADCDSRRRQLVFNDRQK
jgi:ATP-dependent Clp protease ATP-binding subunit ClpA